MTALIIFECLSKDSKEKRLSNHKSLDLSLQ